MRCLTICNFLSPLPVIRCRSGEPSRTCPAEVRLGSSDLLTTKPSTQPSPVRLSSPKSGVPGEGAGRAKIIVSFCLATICMCVGFVRASSPPSTQAATTPTSPGAVPATRPAAGFIRGRISAGVDWDLQKPDLTRAVLYLAADPSLDALAGPLPKAIMGQKDKTFVPSFIVAPVGTLVEFPNWDHISHNVFSRSKAAPAFDLDRYPFGYSKSRIFDKVGVVQVFCNIHQQMRAMIVVTPNPFFVRPDAEGRFEFKGVPLGRPRIGSLA